MPSTNAVTQRKTRMDAERNRIRLIEAAKFAFAEHGALASLEQIARSAEVGIGTLYRHFPTRDALIEAVYRQEIDDLIRLAQHLAQEHEPLEALRSWLLLFVNFLDTKMGIAGVLSTLTGGPDELYRGTPARLDGPIRMLVESALESEHLAPVTDPMNFLRALVGVASIRPSSDWKNDAIEMVDILLHGAGRTLSY